MTRFARWPPFAAMLLAIAALSLVLVSLIQPHYAAPIRGPGMVAPISDGALYAAIVDRVRAGAGYYAAAAEEHRKDGYPTSPPNVFREPTEAVLLARLPGPAARWAALVTLAVAAAFAARSAVGRTSLPERTRLAAVLAITAGLSNAGMPDAPYMHEIWASLLIVLSLSAYQMKRPGLAAVLGLGACLVRELALPYILVMACMDAVERRWRETLCWLVAAMVFVTCYAVHLHRAAALHLPGDVVSSGWVGFGGWRFVLLTARRNAFLALVPSWVVASVVVVAAIGLAGCRDRWVTRIALVVLGYLAAVTVVGRPDNEYWGVLWAPLLPVGLAVAPAALRDLARQIWPGGFRRLVLARQKL
jgi:hypothetical protein